MAKKKGAGPRALPDHYSIRAKKEGYPARSVYKLEEIQQKFRIITPETAVLDIGAAPGSWTLYIRRKLLGSRGTLTAVDLNPLTLSPLPDRITVLTGDAFSPEIVARLIELGPYRSVVSDAAPSTTGSRSVDTLRSQSLAESILVLIPRLLERGGNLVIKIFQGGGEQQIVGTMRGLFSRVKAFKPQACRKDSFETYLIGIGFAPSAPEKAAAPSDPSCREEEVRCPDA